MSSKPKKTKESLTQTLFALYPVSFCEINFIESGKGEIFKITRPPCPSATNKIESFKNKPWAYPFKGYSRIKTNSFSFKGSGGFLQEIITVSYTHLTLPTNREV